MLDAPEWHRVLSVNLTGTFLVAKHVIGRMLDQPAEDGRRGSVVTIASIEGLEGTAGGSVYCASKGGVVLLTKNMAIDYAGRGIRVNSICPGFIETPMLESVFGMPGMETVLAEIEHEHKLRRQGQPGGDRRDGRVLAVRRRLVRDRPRVGRRWRVHGRQGPWGDRAARPLGPEDLDRVAGLLDRQLPRWLTGGF